MQILLVNDDGIYAPGLIAMQRALTLLGDVQVVAPAFEQSGVGLSITYRHPLMVKEEHRENKHFGWAVSGSPADCVKLGILEFCATRPDLVVSGINSGANVGINVLYSGTVAGAIEGAFHGVNSIAISQATDTDPDYNATATRAVTVIKQILTTKQTAGTFWNLNFPQTSPELPRGLKITSMGVRRHVDVIEKRHDPTGKAYYWSGFEAIDHHQQEPNSDLKELAEGYATLTPCHFDLSQHSELDELREQSWEV